MSKKEYVGLFDNLEDATKTRNGRDIEGTT